MKPGRHDAEVDDDVDLAGDETMASIPTKRACAAQEPRSMLFVACARAQRTLFAFSLACCSVVGMNCKDPCPSRYADVVMHVLIYMYIYTHTYFLFSFRIKVE